MNQLFHESDNHFEIIFDIAKTYNGVIFNGNEILNDEGYIILGKNGATELMNCRLKMKFAAIFLVRKI